MTDNNHEIGRELATANQATQKFIAEYSRRMRSPVRRVGHLVLNIEKSSDDAILTGLTSMEKTLTEMEVILRDLLRDLNQADIEHDKQPR